ncbi:MAG: single-stranded DNA-binding protein [Melioribacteraceae bacterium]|nr:single-stranded DNA-binding protein [Melioribacteraceae bacterium]
MIGRLGSDAIIRQAGSGSVANFRIASSSSYKPKDSQEWVEKTTWQNCVLWNPTDYQIRNFLKKGARVFVEGPIEHREYEDGGEKKYICELFVKAVMQAGELADGNGGSGNTQRDTPSNSEPATGGQPGPDVSAIADDDLPI